MSESFCVDYMSDGRGISNAAEGSRAKTKLNGVAFVVE